MGSDGARANDIRFLAFHLTLGILLGGHSGGCFHIRLELQLIILSFTFGRLASDLFISL